MLFQSQTLNTFLMSAISSMKFPSLPNHEKNKLVEGMPGMKQTAEKWNWIRARVWYKQNTEI